jgi:hypothetical protein
VPETTTLHMNTSLLETVRVPYFSADDRFRTILDYRSYRLVNRSGIVSSRTSGIIAEYADRGWSQTPIKFLEVPAVSALRFLRILRIVFDDTGISEGVALRIIPHFLDEPATTTLQRALRIHGGTVYSYTQAVAQPKSYRGEWWPTWDETVGKPPKGGESSGGSGVPTPLDRGNRD